MEGPALSSFLVPIAWAVFAGATILTVLVGVVLAYHWFRFAMNPPVAFAATVIYAIGGGLLLSGVLAAAIAIQITY